MQVFSAIGKANFQLASALRLRRHFRAAIHHLVAAGGRRDPWSSGFGPESAKPRSPRGRLCNDRHGHEKGVVVPYCTTPPYGVTADADRDATFAAGQQRPPISSGRPSRARLLRRTGSISNVVDGVRNHQHRRAPGTFGAGIVDPQRRSSAPKKSSSPIFDLLVSALKSRRAESHPDCIPPDW